MFKKINSFSTIKFQLSFSIKKFLIMLPTSKSLLYEQHHSKWLQLRAGDQQCLKIKQKKSNLEPARWYPQTIYSCHSIFCVPANSCTSGQLFSKAEEFIAARRCALSLDMIYMILFLNNNDQDTLLIVMVTLILSNKLLF